MSRPPLIVGHLAPDLDCLASIWVLRRFGRYAEAQLAFVAAGSTFEGLPADADPAIVHVDTGGGRFDHHQSSDTTICASELVRRELCPDDPALRQMIEVICRNDHGLLKSGESLPVFGINQLVSGLNSLYPEQPERVLEVMELNFNAWYQQVERELGQAQRFAGWQEFETPWGLGIAVEGEDSVASRIAYSQGAVLFVYRDLRGWMGIAARSHSSVDLSQVYKELRRADPGADWFLHASRRMLLCGTPKAPPRVPSRLSLAQLIGLVRGDGLFSFEGRTDGLLNAFI